MYSKMAVPPENELSKSLHRMPDHAKITADSRRVREGDTFIAYQGEYTDGRDYIQAAIDKGAAFVYWDNDGKFQFKKQWDIPNQGIRHLREYAGIIAAKAYGQEQSSLKIIGVTGTNGKTSITQWIAQAIDILEKKNSCAIIGTVGNGYWGALQAATHTTPDPVSVQTLLHKFQQSGATHIAMEVSSHGLHQYRVNGVPFQTAVFTNLTRDHLDYHADMAEYGEIKSRLFHWHHLRHAIINIDDPFGAHLLAQLKTTDPELAVYSYGFHAQADIRITQWQANTQGMHIELDTPWGRGSTHTRLLGRFNALNFVAALGVLCAQKYDFQAALNALAHIRPATGRMDCIFNENKPLVVIDYAHTPDALEKALDALREITPPQGKLWCVFGCGGNRDRGKRPLMGAIAAQGSDCPVITSDNPRMESPDDIIADIMSAVPNAALVEVDRHTAIEQVITRAAEQDVILIAGKGHENYQEIQGIKTYFSDFDVAKTALEKR